MFFITLSVLKYVTFENIKTGTTDYFLQYFKYCKFNGKELNINIILP